MDLMITTYGSYLHRKGELFLVRSQDSETPVPARKVRSILIATSASLSTDAILLALEKNIDIQFLDHFGSPYGRVWHGRPGSTMTIRRTQLRIADSSAGVLLARGWVERKLENQITCLQETRRRRTKISSELTDASQALKATLTQLQEVQADSLDAARGAIMSLEAQAARRWWEAVNLLLPESARFAQRSRNPAVDAFNCLLNYAYGVLYGTVERAATLAGLDPYVGFIHTDHYNKPSLVFDLIECYRIWADESVIALFTAREVRDAFFDPLNNGLTLNKEGKAALMGRLGSHLEESIRYRNRLIKRRDSVQLDLHALAHSLIDLARSWDPALPPPLQNDEESASGDEVTHFPIDDEAPF